MINVIVIANEKEKIIQIKKTDSDVKTILGRESLMQALIREGYYISAVCGGKGRCKKCKVRVLQYGMNHPKNNSLENNSSENNGSENNSSAQGAKAPISDADKKAFTEKELKEGWRLSCTLYPEEDMVISFEQKDESDFEIVGGEHDAYQCKGEAEAVKNEKGRYDVAIDIGTTTIALELLNQETGLVCAASAVINSQRKYGADVISRIEAAVSGKAELLKSCIQTDLQKGIRELIRLSGVSPEQIKRICISANTTMVHLLMGYDCSGLGVFPFHPVNIGMIQGTAKEILGIGISGIEMSGSEIPGSEIPGSEIPGSEMPGITEDANVIILPGISTYVGGDIVSGLYECDMQNADEVSLLVDLGTNGEMAIGKKDRILVTSTAAGPAFEGGNIHWGTGSVAGAICSVKIEEGQVKIQTIGQNIDQKAPVGICGTGVVETVAELLKAELMDETGRLEETFAKEGFPLARTISGEWITFTQKDVREIQLAKAAIRAGIEVLALRFGIEKQDISNVYLAGGFGYRMDTQKAMEIGMIPREFAGKIKAIGNSSLAGAKKYLRMHLHGEKTDADVLRQIVGQSTEIELSADRDFTELYMDAMLFENE